MLPGEITAQNHKRRSMEKPKQEYSINLIDNAGILLMIQGNNRQS